MPLLEVLITEHPMALLTISPVRKRAKGEKKVFRQHLRLNCMQRNGGSRIDKVIVVKPEL